eukprot:TRINITY_DN15134_c0_g1_i2.p1 TRINITY_DN15134_c0_g1~~TRINITY_DN15134_c0_g1_i2.p1  ORF type:complete len:104 (-),score=17.86 TRINITY_DN15134_c0_g1_i2:139-414(-)
MYQNLEATDTPRVVNLNRPDLNNYKNNYISNTKYTLITFVPKFLWLQFGSFMNVYFIVIASLQLIPTLAPVSPITIWAPLCLIFSISATRG